MPRPLFTCGKDPVPIVQEAGWAPRSVWTDAENLAPPEFDPRTVHELQYDVEYDSSLRHYARYVMKRVMNWQELRNQTQCEDTRNWRNFRKSIRTKSMLQEEEMEERTRNRSFI